MDRLLPARPFSGLLQAPKGLNYDILDVDIARNQFLRFGQCLARVTSPAEFGSCTFMPVRQWLKPLGPALGLTGVLLAGVARADDPKSFNCTFDSGASYT